MEQLTMQSLGFLIEFQGDIKVPRPQGAINNAIIRASYRVSRRFHNPRPHAWNQ